ncbi:MAG TPA: RNA polymerase sigma factor SigJ [Chloroflexota bacterium]|nr:RNA polymerase sigma factor SigJ [Chloroflexota bacterium]
MAAPSEAQLFETLRPGAFAVAYRMLGSVGEAEDMVQEAFLRLHRTLQEGERLDSPRAYLSTVVTRLCIDHLRAARTRREQYVGEWLPEPLVEGAGDDPAHHAEVADSLSLAFLVLLERLSPEQRAAFLLRDVFDYDYEEIARIIGTSEDNARQLAARARKHVQASRPRFEASPERREQLAQRFFAAVEEGDLKALEELLAQDVVLHGDGGGRVTAIPGPLHGRARIARTLLAWARAAVRAGGYAMRRVTVNGQPGAMLFDSRGRLISVLALEIADGHIRALSSIINPDKLRHLGPPTDLLR